MSIIIELINKLSQSLMSKSKFFLENKNIKTKHPAHFCIFFFSKAIWNTKMFEQRQQANSSTTIAEEDGSLAEVEKYFINVIATFLNFLYDKC